MIKSELQIEKTKLKDVYEIQPFISKDDRGYLKKGYSYEFYNNHNILFQPVETLLIESEKNVLRGLHFQKEKPIQKLLSCIYGELFVVVIDINKQSEQFGKHFSLVLNDKKSLYIGIGYAVGTYAISKSLFFCENGEKLYPEYDAGIRWNDLFLDIKWPFYSTGEKPILSSRDKEFPCLKEYCEAIS